MCRNCGALVGSTEESCSLCGASKATAASEAQSQAPRQMHDRETIRFARAILSRPYIFTIVFLVANIFIYFLMTSSGGASGAVLVAYGAKLNFLIDAGEWWRFVTPIFLHAHFPNLGPLHLISNMYGLWMLGQYVERLYGSAKFVFFWVVSGIAGVVASYLSVQPALYNSGGLGRFLFKAHDAVSVGASGALFGLIGVLFVFGIKFRRELPEGFKRAFGTGMLPTILINIFIGYAIPVIDNAAHMGGLLMGGLLALVVGYKRPGERGPVAVFWHFLQFAALALVITSFVMVARRFNEPLPAPIREKVAEQSSNGDADSPTFYLNALSTGEAAFIKAYNDGDVSEIDSAIESLDRAPQLDDKADVLLNDVKSLLIRIKEFPALAKPPDRKQAQARNVEKQKLAVEFQSWQQKRLEWMKTEGSKYGIRLLDKDSGKPNAGNEK